MCFEGFRSTAEHSPALNDQVVLIVNRAVEIHLLAARLLKKVINLS